MPRTLKVKNSSLRGSLQIPSSKSHTMRALLFAAMAHSKSIIKNYLKSSDTLAMIEALKLLGMECSPHNSFIEITPHPLKPCANIIDAGNSGIILRFVAALSALLPTYTIITGDHSIRNNRPINALLSGLTQLKAFAVSSKLDDRPPLIIKGPCEPGKACLNGEDSQPVSALLIAASFLEGTTNLEIENPGEKPWIDLTLSWLHKLGGRISHKNYSHYEIKGPLIYSGFQADIPGDFSSAAFPLVAALITKSQITIEGIDFNDDQGDKRIIPILEKMGASFDIKDSQLSINGLCPIKGIKIDANDCIDALPILSTLGCFAEGKTEIYNASIARKKESDRISAITSELKKMGAHIIEKEDGLIIEQSLLKGCRVNSFKDHRIAMALSIAALAADGESFIEDIECIEKSFPSFISLFQSIGADFCE